MLLKEILKDTNKWKDIPCAWTVIFNSVNMLILPKAIYRFNAILVKIPMTFFAVPPLFAVLHLWKKSILKFIWNLKRPWIAKTNLEKNNQIGGLRLPGFKTYNKAAVIKAMWYWSKDRNTEQWNRIERPELNSHVYDQITFDKCAKTIHWGKNNLFNKWCWDNFISTCKRIKLNLYLT